MRIIVEGPDNSGKTTLISKLCNTMIGKILYGPVVNTAGPNADFDKFWLEQLPVSGVPFGLMPIHDRFFYSELVYGPVIRGSIRGKGSTLLKVLNELRYDALLIYARPPLHVMTDTLGDREQMAGVRERMVDLVEEYDGVMTQELPHYGARFLPYDFTNLEAAEAVSKTVRRYLDGEL